MERTIPSTRLAACSPGLTAVLFVAYLTTAFSTFAALQPWRIPAFWLSITLVIVVDGKDLQPALIAAPIVLATVEMITT